MNLEDHLGDIIRKARLSRNVPAAETAKAAGLTESELAAVEQSGQLPRPLNYTALAPLISLDPGKLERIANGWRPVDAATGAWRGFRLITTSAEDMSVNAFLIWDDTTREAALFDTGWEAGPILELIGQNALQLRHIFITHSHPDHIAALEPLRARFPLACLHTDSKSAPAQHRNHRDDCIQIGRLRVTNRETPGHAEDGVTYVVSHWPDHAPQAAMVGDAIFSASMGRGNQSWDLAKQKVRENILTLPGDTLLCPGHGPLTTVAQELANNPFF